MEDDQVTDFSKRYSDEVEEEDDSFVLLSTAETPLMYSRSNSVESLNSNLKMNEANADHVGSNINEFSRHVVLAEVEEVGTLKPIDNQQKSNSQKQQTTNRKKPIPPPKPAHLIKRPNDAAKSVTFGDGNIIETPLMYSRSSSPDSLSSVDLKMNEVANADDAGSVISEFSRLTSQAVSPSDLPDSPGQSANNSYRTPGYRSEDDDDGKDEIDDGEDDDEILKRCITKGMSGEKDVATKPEAAVAVAATAVATTAAAATATAAATAAVAVPVTMVATEPFSSDEELEDGDEDDELLERYIAIGMPSKQGFNLRLNNNNEVKGTGASQTFAGSAKN